MLRCRRHAPRAVSAGTQSLWEPAPRLAERLGAPANRHALVGSRRAATKPPPARLRPPPTDWAPPPRRISASSRSSEPSASITGGRRRATCECSAAPAAFRPQTPVAALALGPASRSRGSSRNQSGTAWRPSPSRRSRNGFPQCDVVNHVEPAEVRRLLRLPLPLKRRDPFQSAAPRRGRRVEPLTSTGRGPADRQHRRSARRPPLPEVGETEP